MSVRWLTFLTWALVAGSAVFWVLRLAPPGVTVPPHAAVASVGVQSSADLSRLWGADPVKAAPAAASPGVAPPPEQSRFQLVGLAASPTSPARGGVALIALDGKPARAYRAGAVIDGAYVLQQVLPRSVSIGERGQPAAFSLELPALPPPATGVPGGGAPAAGMPAPLPMSQPAAPVVLQPPPGAGVAPSLAVQPPPSLGGNAVPAGPGSPAGRLRALRPGGAAVSPYPGQVPPGVDGSPAAGDGQPPLADSEGQVDRYNRR